MTGGQQFALEAGIGLVGFMFFGSITLAWAMWKRSRYNKETLNHIKGVYFSEGAAEPEVLILAVGADGSEVTAPHGHRIGTYFLNRKAMFDTMYPEKPFMGLWFIQVPIKTQWWDRDNPEPLTSYKHEPVATPESIFAASDTNYMFALRQAKNELEAGRKELLKAQANKLNANAVYLLLGINTLGLIGVAIFLMKYGSTLTKIAGSIGVK